MTGGESKPAVPVLENELSIRIRVANGCSEVIDLTRTDKKVLGLEGTHPQIITP